MPELPDVTIYIERLEALVIGRPLETFRLGSPFLIRTVSPRPQAAEGRKVVELRRLGKRIAMGFEGDLWFVIHLMIAGRLRWKTRGVRLPRRLGLAALDFPDGTLLFTEAGTKRRASLHVVEGEAGVAAHDPGGIDVFAADADAFAAALTTGNHTVKRALTDPRLLSGIGNAYSDEILHRAGLSPFKLTSQLTNEELARVHAACRDVLSDWTARLRAEVGDGFPDKVTAFREDFATHGRYRQPCPVCGSPIQRIVYASNETNYCPLCQTGGRILADRSLSRLLRKDFPRTMEELESLHRRGETARDPEESA